MEVLQCLPSVEGRVSGGTHHRVLPPRSCRSRADREHLIPLQQSLLRVLHGLSLMDPFQKKGEAPTAASRASVYPELTALLRLRSEAAYSPRTLRCRMDKGASRMIRQPTTTLCNTGPFKICRTRVLPLGLATIAAHPSFVSVTNSPSGSAEAR